MKLLLDENLPHQLRLELPGHECFTVAYMGWSGVENGALLAQAASTDFDALLTKDANLQYEQNLVNLLAIKSSSRKLALFHSSATYSHAPARSHKSPHAAICSKIDHMSL